MARRLGRSRAQALPTRGLSGDGQGLSPRGRRRAHQLELRPERPLSHAMQAIDVCGVSRHQRRTPLSRACLKQRRVYWGALGRQGSLLQPPSELDQHLCLHELQIRRWLGRSLGSAIASPAGGVGHTGAMEHAHWARRLPERLHCLEGLALRSLDQDTLVATTERDPLLGACWHRVDQARGECHVPLATRQARKGQAQANKRAGGGAAHRTIPLRSRVVGARAARLGTILCIQQREPRADVMGMRVQQLRHQVDRGPRDPVSGVAAAACCVRGMRRLHVQQGGHAAGGDAAIDAAGQCELVAQQRPSKGRRSARCLGGRDPAAVATGTGGAFVRRCGRGLGGASGCHCPLADAQGDG